MTDVKVLNTLKDFANLPVGTKLKRIKPNGKPHHFKSLDGSVECDGNIVVREKKGFYSSFSADTEGDTTDKFYVKDGVLWCKKYSTEYLKDIIARAEKIVQKYVDNKADIIAEWESTERSTPEALQGLTPLKVYETELERAKSHLKTARQNFQRVEYLAIYGYKVVTPK